MKNTINIIKSLHDNYIFSIENKEYAWIVDPGEASPVKRHLQQNQLKLAGILITHHHADHTAGIADLSRNKEMPIIGGELTANKFINTRVKEGSKIYLKELAIELEIIETPGHTLDHICYFNENYIFCGDTLFSAGCGRVFEGTYEQMANSIAKIAKLNKKAKLYCAHEYTLSNLEFAKTIEPSNNKIKQELKLGYELNKQNQPSIPTCIKKEEQINPYLRYKHKHIRENFSISTKLKEDTAIFKEIRLLKDNFT